MDAERACNLFNMFSFEGGIRGYPKPQYPKKIGKTAILHRKSMKYRNRIRKSQGFFFLPEAASGLFLIIASSSFGLALIYGK